MKTRYITTAALMGILGLTLTATQAMASGPYPRPHEVNGRLETQHDRIKQGVASGQLTRREAETVRLKDARIHAQELRDRLAHNGHLTAGEYKQLNGELNHNSWRIFRDKHNGATR